MTRPQLSLTPWLGASVAALFALACGEGRQSDGLPTGLGATPQPVGPLVIEALPFLDRDSAWAGSALVTPPTVRVVHADVGQAGVYGLAVRCAVSDGGGAIQDTTLVTGVFGEATCGQWTLGANPGTNAVTLSVPGAQPITLQTYTRARPNVIAHYKLVAWSEYNEYIGRGPTTLTGGEILLGDDGSMELGRQYSFWNSYSGGWPPMTWQLLSYVVSGRTLRLADSTVTGEFRGDTLIVTQILGDDGGPPIVHTVYERAITEPSFIRGRISSPFVRPP